jgi:hypothetical protein
MSKDLKLMLQEASKNQKKFIENPTNSFIMIKTLVDLKSYFNSIERIEGKNNKTLKVIIDEFSVIDLPSNEDMEGALNALTRLQTTYLVNVKDFIEGKFNNDSRSFRRMNCKIYLLNNSIQLMIHF